jgi:hypothetical protein
MALHAPLTQFLARLNTDLGAATGVEFLAATGRRLVATHVLPEEEFSRQAKLELKLENPTAALPAYTNPASVLKNANAGARGRATAMVRQRERK